MKKDESDKMWKKRALLAEAALADVLDGNSAYDIKNMTGLDDERCSEIWKVYSGIVNPGVE